jgi:hypothetical protein
MLLSRHRRFWRQLVLWLAQKDDQEGDSLWVRLAQRRLSPGAPLAFDAGVTKADGTPVNDIAIEAVAISPSGKPRAVRVPRKGDAFAGVVAGFDEPGDWKLVLRAARDGQPKQLERTVRFTVYRQDLELANPRANPLLMRQLAEATDGGVRSPEELTDIFDEIRGKPAAFETLEQWSYTPWDKWPMFLLMAGCLCVEWVLRKRWGLV